MTKHFTLLACVLGKKGKDSRKIFKGMYGKKQESYKYLLLVLLLLLIRRDTTIIYPDSYQISVKL